MQNIKSLIKNLKSIIFFPIRFLFRLPNYILPHRIMKRLSPRNRKIVNLGLIALILVLGGYFIWTLLTPKSSDAAWWNDNWLYRQAVSITNSNGSNLSDFQVLVEINTASLITAGKLRSNCNDIRFTDETGNLLPYWIETGAVSGCNTSSTDIWVKVPNVYTTGTNIYLYYGNNSAPAVQNGNMVFELFDDFSGSALDTSKWQEGTIGATSGTGFTVSGGLLSGGNTNRFIRSNAVYSGNYTAEARSFTTTDNVNGYTTIGFFATVNDDFGILDHNNTSYYRNDSNWVQFSLDGTGQWTENTTKIVGTDATYARIGETSGSSTATVTNSGLSSEYVRISARYDDSANNQDYVATWDWITVRKAAATDPTASLGGEEKSQSPVLYFAFDEGTGTTTKDGSPSKVTGTLSAAPAWIPESQCISGSCLFFDGSNTANNQTVIYAESSTSPTNITGDVTISAWIKPSSDYGDASGAILRNGQGADLVYSMFYDYNNKRPFFHWYDGGFPAVQGTTNSVPLDEWSFLSIVRESNVVSFYVNGKLTNSASVTTPTVLSTRMAIGRTDNVDVQQDYTGYLDELKIYPYARPADQILVDFNTRGGNATSTVLGATDFETLSQGLVGYWKMDQSSWNGTAGEVIDSSGSNNNGTAVSGAQASSSAKFGNAGYFAGVDEYISVPNSSSLNPTHAITISTWINGDSWNANNNIISKPVTSAWNAPYGTYDIEIQSNGALINFLLDIDGTHRQQFSAVSLSTGIWYNIVTTYDGSLQKTYLNGTLLSSTALTGSIATSTQPLTIGSRSTTTPSQYFDGNIDETRIYNRALSPEEVSNLYQFAPGPVGYWGFEQGQGGTVTDSSTYGNNGTWVGTGSKWGIGKYGKGGVMNGTDDGVEVTAGDSLKPGRKITVEAWVKMDSYRTGSEWSPIVEGAGNLNTNTGYFLGFDTSNALTFYVGVGTAFPVAYTNESAVPLGKWTHVAGVMDDSTISLYVNGVLVNSASHSYTSISYTSDPLKFGRLSYYSGAGHDMDGSIDEVRIYNYARTPAQIVQDMNAGHPVGGSPVASQVGYWKFDEGFGTSFGNSGNAGSVLNGTFDSTAAWSDGGKFGRALKTNGSATGDASIPDNTAIDFAYNQDFTVSFWMKDGGGNGNDLSVVEKWAVGGGGYPYVFRYVSNSIRFARYDETNNPQILGTKPVNDGNWHYVMGTKNGSTLALYIDGKLQSTTTDTTSGTTTNVSPLFLGSRSGTGQLWNGFIDELKIYNSGMSSSQMTVDMNQGSSLRMGSFGLNPDGTASNSAAQTYCVPGDFSTTSCKPIGEWNFEEGGGITTNDTSTNGRTGTLTSGPIWTTGKVGKALNFDGTDDYVSLANGPDISSGNWTMQAWIYPTAYGASQWRHIFGAEAQTFAFGITSGTLAVTNVTVADCTASSITPPLNAWSHVAATFNDSSNALSYYVNGILANTVTCNTTPTAGRLTQYIGRSLAYSSPFAGKIDQAQIYNYILSSAQIAWNYNKGKPVGYWKLDECQGSTANDSSGFGNTGAITIGGSGSQTSVGTCQTASTAWGNGITGKFNYSLNFDGTDDYITVPDSTALSVSSGPSSWFAWIKPGSVASTATIIRKNTNEYVLATVGSKVWCEFEAGSTINGGSTMSNGQWYHVGCTFDGTTLRSYLNGIQQDSGAATAGTDSNNTLSIGSSNGGSQFFNGQIDDVQIFNYGLTNVQIKNLFNQSSAIRFGPQTGAP